MKKKIKKKIDNFLSIILPPKKLISVSFNSKTIEICELHKNKILKLDSIKINENRNIFVEEDFDYFYDLIQELILRNNLSNRKISISIPKSSSISKQLKIPYMNTKDIVDSLEYGDFWNSKIQLEKKINEYFVFFDVVEELKETNELIINLTMVEKKDLEVYKSFFELLKMEILNISIETYDNKNLINHFINKKKLNIKNYFIIKIGENQGYLTMVKNDKVFTYDLNIPKMDYEELLKINNNTSTISKEDKESLYERLIVNVEAKIKPLLKIEKEIFDIFLIGILEKNEKIIEEFKSKIKNINLHKINLSSFLQFNKKIDDYFKNNQELFFSVIGSSLNKFRYFYLNKDKNIKYFNLLEEKSYYIKKFKTIFYVNLSLFLVNLIILTFVIFYLGGLNSKNKKLKEEINNNSKYQSLILETKEQQQQLEEEKLRYQNQIITKNSLINNKSILFNNLHSINLSIEPELWLEKIEFKDNFLNIYGKSLTDTSVLVFLKNLKEKEDFLDVQLENIKTVQNLTEEVKKIGISNLKDYSLKLNIKKDIQ